MKFKYTLIILFILAFSVSLSDALCAKTLSRQDLISQELNNFSEQPGNQGFIVKNKPTVKEKETPKPTQVKVKKPPRKPKVKYYQEINNEEEFNVTDRKFELGVQRYHYRYAEPDFMKEKDYMNGAFGSITYYPSKSSQNGKKTVNYLEYVDLIRLEAEYNYGLLDYNSEGTGETQNDPYHQVDARIITGKELVHTNSFIFMPYLGLGFRYLLDNSGGKQTSTGHYTYDRETNYFYAPIGVDIHTKLSKSFNLKFNAEYDAFIGGKQKSHLEDVDPGYSTVTNDQKHGYGVRGSIRLTKEQRNVDMFVEPFVRYWNIEDSEISTIAYYGSAAGYGLEPENNTTEIGFKLGANF